MKKSTVLLATLFVLFAGTQRALALPYYYTFEGEVTSTVDTAGIILSQLGAGFGIGSSVEYTFIVDFGADGFYTENDGDVVTYVDAGLKDYFYTDFYSGINKIWATNGGYQTNPLTSGYWSDYGKEYNVGLAYIGPQGNYISGNSEDDGTSVGLNGSLSPKDWVVGSTGLYGYDQAYDSSGFYSSISSLLTLTSITPVESVPEPSILALMAVGLIGLIGFARPKA